MRRNKGTVQGPDSGTFNLSISDLMAGLLAVFILALCYFILNFSQKASRITENNVKRAQLVKQLKVDIQKLGIKVTIDEKRGILRIPENALQFRTGNADIDDKDTVKKIGTVLLLTLDDEKYRGRVETVFIEGHTDDVPINNYRYASNWELSTQRAINTWNVMKDKPNERLALLKNDVIYLNDDNTKEHISEPIFSCSGYAETRPIVANDSDSNRSLNRRIDIRFTMVPPSEEDSEIVKAVKKEFTDEK